MLPIAQVIPLVIVLQKVEIERYDAILIMCAPLAFLGLLEYLAQQVGPKGCGAAAELVEIGLVAQRVDWLRVDRGGESYFC